MIAIREEKWGLRYFLYDVVIYFLIKGVSRVMQDSKTTNGKTVQYNPVSASIFGAIAGAAIGAGTAMVLSDEKKREKVGDFFQEVKKQALDTIREISEKSRDKVKVIEMRQDKKTETDEDFDI